MVYNPRTRDEIYTSLRDGLTNRISRLTNFVETSFNYVWTQAFSSRFRENEVSLLATQLSGWIDYAGGPVTQDDLDSLGVDSVTPAEVNEYMEDEDLDNLVEIVGVSRDLGEQAIGTVTFTTVSSFTQIPAGTSVATQPDADGNFFEYETTELAETPSGTTEVSGVPVEAVENGEEYNVGSGQVTYFPSPPTGVQAVVNPEAVTGGADIETNDDLRARAKNAIFNKSGGGTAAGVKGFVESNTPDVTSVSVAEYPGGDSTAPPESPGGPSGGGGDTPYADVIVEGGEPADIQDSIDEARPVAIQHNFVRPKLIEVNVTASVVGSSVATEEVESAVAAYIDGLDLGEAVYRDKIIQRLMNADPAVENIDDLNVAISDEQITYSSGTTVYGLNKGVQMENDGITEVTGTLSGASHTFDEPGDYDELDNDGDTSDDSIDWSGGTDKPDDGTTFSVTYNTIDDIPVGQYEKGDTNSVIVNVV